MIAALLKLNAYLHRYPMWLKHSIGGAVVATAGFWIAFVWLSAPVSAVIGGTVGVGAGIGKECFDDGTGLGTPSVDAAVLTCGYALFAAALHCAIFR